VATSIREFMQRLILFDIDGTILSTRGVAAGAFREALEEVFGSPVQRSGYSFAGKTDPQIARELLALGEVPEREVEERLAEVWSAYLPRLEARLRGVEIPLLPGVRALVERLHAEPGAVLGLLTGNLVEGARLKLAAAGLDFGYFAVGAFGSDHAERSRLPLLAIERAEARFGHRFSGKAVVIIGDTPLDVACGEHLGVRTIAVATGSYSAEELAACGPDHVFSDLADEEAVWRAIFD
jgi:phosphoglycolate phosphatase-like HAD superfamily hydrolase